MKKMLKRTESEVYHFHNGEKVMGIHMAIRGKVSDIYGNVSGLIGDVTGLTGDVTSIMGDVTGLEGDIDDCELTEDDRKQGINITELIG